MPQILSQILPRAATIFTRDDENTAINRSLPWYGIAGIILLVLAVILSIALISLRVVRRRRKNNVYRDSFVPNNFKIVGSLSSILDSRRTSRVPSVYKPTDQYGNYRPPLPQPAHHHARSASYSNLLLNNKSPV